MANMAENSAFRSFFISPHLFASNSDGSCAVYTSKISKLFTFDLRTFCSFSDGIDELVDGISFNQYYSI